MVPLRLPFKRGATFELDCVVSDALGVPEDITAWAIAAQVRDKDGVLVASLLVTSANLAQGAFKLSAANTTAWPVNQLLYCDIRYTTDTAQIVPTETFEIHCLENITQ